jgi:XTP/dITP diphosphohydrolase
MSTLVIATRNHHKVDEIRSILGSDFVYLTLRHFPGAPVTVEDAGTFEGNARKKSVELALWLSDSAHASGHEDRGGIYVLADDSGLEVDALNGAPGVHSARFAAADKDGGNSTDIDNNARLLRLLKEVEEPRRTARFRCVIALTPVTRTGEGTVCFEGVCEGRIGVVPCGANGFGYDPLFYPAGFSQTFAELGGEVKNHFSHRARALAHLKDWHHKHKLRVG